MTDPIADKKKYNCLENYLNKLTKEKISLDEKEQRKYNVYLDEILNKTLVPAMQENDIWFKCLFKRFLYAGSYYENLKVGKPNEFDLNLQFKLPASEVQIIDDRQPGFVEVKVVTFDEKETRRAFKDIPDWESKLKKAWMDKENFLHRMKVLDWMHKVVLDSVKQLDKISCTRGGPAITLKINHSNQEGNPIEFSVDLVPVFVFGEKDWPQSMRKRINRSSTELMDWCVVPKPPYDQTDVRFWRPSFYAQEKNLMVSKQGMKKSLKLIKLLRDEQKWSGLSSYYIKTVYMWEISKKEQEFWQQHSTSFLLIYMLNKIKSWFEQSKIPFFWDERHNLLGARDAKELQNMKGRIERILKNVEKNLEGNPSTILSFFGWPDEFTPPPTPGSSSDEPSRAGSPEQTMPSPSIETESFDIEQQYPYETKQQPSSSRSPQLSSSRAQQESSSQKPEVEPPEHDIEDPIDWNTVETIIGMGAVAGAVFAAGIYLLMHNAQRQARRRQNNSNQQNNDS